MHGYIASHNWGKTLVLSDGRVFEWREQPGGGGAWHEQHGEKVADIDAYLQQSADEWGADWTELQEDEIAERTGITAAPEGADSE